MLKKRIIPCLDIMNGRTVKGINFVGLRDAGDPIALAKLYSEQGADELVFLDITATVEKRKTLIQLVDNIAKHINIPFTVGGGISTLDDVKACLDHGADKVALNSALVKTPQLISEVADFFGSQCIVAAVDSKQLEGDHFVYTHGGRKKTEINTLAWVQEIEQKGAGELLITSMDHDGTKNGFANQLYLEISQLVNIPLIASGGAGTMSHFYDTFNEGHVDAALAASIFHFNEIPIKDLKQHLHNKGIAIRL